MQKIVDRVSLGAVHTHTHTHTHTCTFRKIRRVANSATLCSVANRLFIVLIKNKVLEIACFLRFKKLFYTKFKVVNNTEKVGGVE